MYGVVSVVIPVYNVEKYIKECLDSIVNQTYKDLQIILVDDGSTDSSGKICDEYAQKDNRITVVHQKNAGAGAAKNTGLEHVKGKYLSIIDSDDFIELDMYEKMLSYMISEKVDVVQCGFNDYFVNEKKSRGFDCRKLNVSNFLKEFPYEWRYAIFANKMFKIELLSDTRFPVGRKIDDEFFTYKLIVKAKNIYNTGDTLYNYRMRKSSVMNESNNDKLIEDRIDCFVQRYEFIKDNKPKISKYFYRHLSDILLYYRTCASSDELKRKLEYYIKKYPYNKPTIIQRLFAKKVMTVVVGDKNDFILFD